MRPEHWLFTIPLRLRSLFRWAQADQEVDDELRRRIIGSVSISGTSCSKVSSADTDCVGLSGMTSLLSMPRSGLVF